MITRIVKMTFQEQEIEKFLAEFERRRVAIGSFDGCEGVELLRDVDQPNIFFTYSRWHNVEALEQYRRSELFQETWAYVRPLFSAKAEAWTVQAVEFPSSK